MGKVKEKLPTPDTNPVDGDKLIEETKPKKKVAKTTSKKESEELIWLKDLQADVNKIGDWIADVDDELQGLSKLVIRMANRLGLE